MPGGVFFTYQQVVQVYSALKASASKSTNEMEKLELTQFVALL